MSRRRGRHHLQRRDRVDNRAAIEAGADEAFASGKAVVVGEVVVAPDVLVLAAIAAGHPHPKTWRLVRDDGRWAEIYRAPRGQTA